VTTTSPTLEAARDRALARRARFVAAGSWRTAPIDLVHGAASSAPDKTAIVARDETLTNAQLDNEVQAAVASLHAAGVEAGDSVLVVAGNDVASIVAIHAVLRMEAVALLVMASAGHAHVNDVISGAEPVVALAPSSWIERTPQVAAGIRWLGAESLRPGATGVDLSRAASVDVAGREPDDPAVVLFTSGTTSRPKGVIHSLNTLLAASDNYIEGGVLRPSDRLFLVSPLASITGVLQAITVPPMLQAPVVLEDRFDAPATLRWLMHTGATWFGGPDLLLDRLLDEADDTGVARLPIQAVFLGGSMLDPRILARAEARGIVVMRAYGSSEAPISTATGRGEDAAVRLADEGRPLGGVEVRIGSEHDDRECCLGGPHLFLGYRDPSDDEHAFVDDWFCTGDIAELTDGRLRIVGRIKDIVIRNGLKIPMTEVEAMATQVPGVERAAAFGAPDDATGEHLVLAVIADDPEKVRLDHLVAVLKTAGLATWKLPEELVHWGEPFPETATGKVNRQLLAEASANLPRELVDRLRPA